MLRVRAAGADPLGPVAVAGYLGRPLLGPSGARGGGRGRRWAAGDDDSVRQPAPSQRGAAAIRERDRRRDDDEDGADAQAQDELHG
jgi:hypothetical protein